MSVVSKLQIVLEATTTAFDRGLRKAQDGLNAFAKQTDKIHAKMESFQKRHQGAFDAMQAIGAASAIGLVAIGAGIKATTAEAMKFESAMAEVKKVVNFESPDGIKQMRAELEELSTRVPIAFDGLAKIAAAAGQSGIAANEIVKFTEAAAKMGTAFDITAEQAGQAMAEMRTAFKMSQAEVETLADKINYLGNNSPNAAAKIMEVVQRIGPLGEIAGVSADQIAAMAASLTSVEPDVAATGLKNMMLQLVKGESLSKSAKAAFDDLGLSYTEIAKGMQTDSIGTINKVFEAIKKLPEEAQAAKINDIFGSESIAVISQLINGTDTLGKHLQAMGDASKYAGSMSQEAANINDTSAAKMEMFKNATQNAKAAIGDAFLPALGALAEALLPVINGIKQFAQENPTMVTAITGIVGGALVLGTALGAIGLAVPLVTTAFGGLTAIAGLVGTAIGAISLPVVAAIAAIAGLVAAGVWLYNNWDMVKAKAIEVWNAIPQYADQAWQWISGVWSGVGAWFSGIWDSVVSSVNTAWAAIKQAFANWLAGMPAPVQEMVANIGSIFSGIATIASAAWAGITAVAKTVFSAVVAAWQGLSSAVSSAWQGIVSVASSVWNSVKSAVQSAINAIKPIITSVTSFFSSAWNGLVSVAQSVWNGVKAAVSAGINGAKAVLTAGVTGFAIIFNTGFNAVKTIVSTVFNAIKALVRGDINGVKTAIQSGLSQLAGIARTAVSQIVSAFKNLGSQLLQAGRDAVQGFINGLTGKMGEALAKAREMASKVISTVKGALDIHSPSRVMKALGNHTADGMAVGIEQNTPKAVKAAQKMADDIKKTVADSVANLKREIALFGNDSPIDALKYDISIGKYKGADTKELEALTAQKYALERNKVALDEIDGIKEKIALVGKNELETLKYQLEHADKYKGVSDDIKQSYLERTEALNEAVKAQERLNKVEAATADIAKNKHILTNWQDKHAGLKYDLGKDGYDASQIDQIVQAEAVKEQVGKLQQLFSDISNKQVFATPKITANLANKGGGFDFAGQMLGQSFDIAKKFEEQNALLKAAREQGLIEEEAYLKQSEALTQAHVEAKTALMQSATQSVLGGITGIMKNVYGEQSKHYKAAFAMEKAYAVATILMKQKEAIAKAWASAPFPANLGAVASTLASTGALAAAVNAIRPVGQAHDGIMSVPKSGTWNLEKGERVLPKHTAQNLDNTLNRLQGRGETKVIINNYTSEKAEVQKNENGDIMVVIGKVIDAKINQRFMNARRQGGELYGR